ncbi:MAG: flagellum-specific ATP synthase FliI, partial [Steroidobacteraceae bacterium]
MRVERQQRWIEQIAAARQRVEPMRGLMVEGTLNRMVGMTLEAVGCEAAVGGRCLIAGADGRQIEAEVVGFGGDKLYLMPTDDIRGLMPGARVTPTRSVSEVPVGDALLGRVLDGAGRPLDALGEIKCDERMPLMGSLLNPLQRRAIREPLDVGVRSINSLL